MNVPENYSFDLTERRRQQYFPNLKFEQNFVFTSLKTDDYNCVAWSLKIDDEWIQYDLNVEDYINHFSGCGFRFSENEHFVKGVEKIAIYADYKNQFTHVARQLDNGKWTSKLGDWEDIEHDTLDALSGDFYGKPFIIMEK